MYTIYISFLCTFCVLEEEYVWWAAILCIKFDYVSFDDWFAIHHHRRSRVHEMRQIMHKIWMILSVQMHTYPSSSTSWLSWFSVVVVCSISVMVISEPWSDDSRRFVFFTFRVFFVSVTRLPLPRRTSTSAILHVFSFLFTLNDTNSDGNQLWFLWTIGTIENQFLFSFPAVTHTHDALTELDFIR